ncbi:MAG: TIR domain-containing protein [Gracilibacteraceae bacterium]|jgi:WD40 repeat protein|nr:TIR domain-containing protein [Gracilibacteraceae bacterium]
MENKAENFQYEAFISYRHKDLDMLVARAVHRSLETFRIPGHIGRNRDSKRIGRVFRDQDELPLMADLEEGIKRALRQSRWLIVICSPDLPLSKWCMAEIDYFIELGRRDNILTILISGEPEASFPPQIRFRPDGAGGFTEREPLAADIRAPNARAALKRLRVEKLRLLAPMLGVGFDDLRRRERERFFRLVVSSSLAAALFFAVFGGFALAQAVTIERQNEELTAQKAKVYANFSHEQLVRGNRAGAALLALEALPEDMKSPVAAEAKNALYAAAYHSYNQYGYDRFRPLAQTPGSWAVPAPDGKTFVAADTEYTRVYDAETFRLIYEHPGATTTIMAFESGGVSGAQVKRAVYNKSGEIVFLPGGEPVFVNVRTGETIREGYFTDADELAEFGLSRYECVLPYSGTGRHVIDLGSGKTLFAAPSQHGTSKNLFSPDGRYYILATYAGLSVFDIAQGQPVAFAPCDGISVAQGYTFFSPDSRFLVLTREALGRVPAAEFEETRRTYSIQILEIPSCRVVYETAFLGQLIVGASESNVLPNYSNSFDSDVPACLFAPDSSKLVLPVGAGEFGVFDLARERMLFTRKESLGFASFSPSGRHVLTVSQTGHAWELLDAESGEQFAGFYDGGISFGRGFVLPADSVLIAGSAAGDNFCGIYELREPDDAKINMENYFADESGLCVLPATEGKNAAVADGRDGKILAELEDSAEYTKAERFAAVGGIIVGLSDAGTESVLTSWDAATGERLVESFPQPEYQFSDEQDFPPSFFLSADGARVAAIYQMYGASKGGFRTFDARTGELLAESDGFFLDGAIMRFDRDVTKLLYVYDNAVSVFDALSGQEVFALDDYPGGQLALGTWSGQRVALSGDGALLAVSHSKKNTLEIIDAATGQRLHEIALNGPASTNPCFSRDGGRVAVGAGKYLFSVDAGSGQVLFSVYDEAGFSADCAFSADGRYLLGAGIRDAATGEVVCVVDLPARPVWEIIGTGIVIPVGKSHAVYLPSIDEALADLRAHIRDYAFTQVDKLRFALD